jgi:RNA polymerase sigma-70 factor (ECF subfamily)
MQSPAVDERDLVAAFVAGDPAALRSIYDAHQRLVFTFCRTAVGDDAADVTQEVFISAWRSRDRFDRSAGSMSGWLMGIARHKVLDHLRKAYRTRDTATADLEAAVPFDARTEDDDTAAVERAVDQHAERLLVADALSRLPEPGRGMIRMSFVDGLSHTEISGRTGTPLGTVKSTIRRGLLALRRDLEQLDASR